MKTQVQVRPIKLLVMLIIDLKLQSENIDHDGTRTHNLPIRSRTPYPLGHAAAGRFSLKGYHIKTLVSYMLLVMAV